MMNNLPPIGEHSRPLTKAQAVTLIRYTFGLDSKELAEKLFEEWYGKHITEILPQVLGTSLFSHDWF